MDDIGITPEEIRDLIISNEGLDPSEEIERQNQEPDKVINSDISLKALDIFKEKVFKSLTQE